jgi:ABC-type sugar transport system substrate-binding protein
VISTRSWRHMAAILAAASMAVASLGGGALAQEEQAEPAEATAECAVGTSEVGIPAEGADVALFHQMTPLEGSETVDTAAFAKEGPYVIGFSDWGLVNSHRVQTRGAMEILARELGVTLQITDAGGDTSKQIADVDDLLTRGIDALVIAPAVADALGPAIERAHDGDVRVLVGDWNEDRGKAITQNLLAANPQIDGVWSSGAAMTKGAISAFQEAGRDLPPMSGEHLNGFLKLWEELGIRSVAPVYPSWMGPEALKLAVLALQGECVYKDYLVLPDPITNEDLAEAVEPDVSDDYWVEGYLTDEQILEVFPQ